MDEIFQLSYISTNTTTTIAASGNVKIHTVNCPIATTGTVTFEDITGTPVVYFVLPIGSIGSFILDSSAPNGLKIVTSAADVVITTYKLP